MSAQQPSVVIQHQEVLQTSAPVQPSTMPEAYTDTAPLNEAELTSLLLASPLYRKMDNIKKQLAKASGKKEEDNGNTIFYCINVISYYSHFLIK